MRPDFLVPADAPSFVLRGATLPLVAVDGFEAPPHIDAREGLVTADLVIADGLIDGILAPGTAPVALPGVDMGDRMAWPSFVDMHTHIDKGHIWGRSPNPTGDFWGALDTVRSDREARWTAEDVKARMEFSLKCAYAHGTKLLRTHLDSIAPQHRISFEVFAEIRDNWKDRIALQAAALFPLDAMDDEAAFKDLVEVVVAHGGLLGGLTQMWPDLDARLDAFFRVAAENGLDIDMHVDETQDKQVLTLKAIAEAKLRNRFDGAVTVGHCCSLTRQDADIAKATIEKVAEAGISVVSLPMCNMYLQDRHPGRTPHQRGVTMFKELAAAGVATAVSSDNTRDPFYAYGDLDPVEVFRESVRILHLDHPLDDAARIVTRTPADILKRPDIGRIAVGLPADLVIFNARHWSEFLSRPQADRIVMRNGKGIDRSLPDYRELDPLMRD